MNSGSHASPRLSWVKSHLVLAEAVLDLQVRVNAITQELAQRQSSPGSGPPRPMIDWERLARAMEALRDALSSPAVQTCIGLLSPLVVAVVRWLLKWLGI